MQFILEIDFLMVSAKVECIKPFYTNFQTESWLVTIFWSMNSPETTKHSWKKVEHLDKITIRHQEEVGSQQTHSFFNLIVVVTQIFG